MLAEPKHPQADLCSSSMLAQSMKLSNEADIESLGSDGADIESLSSNEAHESAATSDGEDNLQRDIRLILQEHSGNVIKKWGNSEQWLLELRDGRRVAVPIQISLPPGEVTEVLEEQNQLALKSSNSLEMSLAQFDGDEVLVEPLAFSLPLAMEGQEVVGVESPVRKESYSEWF